MGPSGGTDCPLRAARGLISQSSLTHSTCAQPAGGRTGAIQPGRRAGAAVSRPRFRRRRDGAGHHLHPRSGQGDCGNGAGRAAWRVVATYMWDTLNGGVPLAPIEAALKAIGKPPPSPASAAASGREAMQAFWQAAR